MDVSEMRVRVNARRPMNDDVAIRAESLGQKYLISHMSGVGVIHPAQGASPKRCWVGSYRFLADGQTSRSTRSRGAVSSPRD